MRVIFLLAVFSVAAFATTYTINPGDPFVPTLQSLSPGDIVNFQAGTHTITSRGGLVLTGSLNNPIIIQGVGNAIIERGNADNNIFDIGGNDFIIRNIEFVGGSRGIRMGDGNSVSNAVFEDVKIHGTESTAFSFNDPGLDYNNITIRRVEIYDTGYDTSECLYTGCNENGCVFRNSLIENLYCHDTMNAYDGYGSGVNMKSGSYNNIVRNSVFWNVKGPGVFFYDSYDLGNNLAEGNIIVNNGDNGIQVTAGAIIRNNIVINSAGSGIAGATNQLKAYTSPRNIQLLGNTVIGSQSDVCLRGNSWGAASITVANNAFFCGDAPGGAFKINGDQSSATWVNNAYNGGDAPSGAESGVFAVGDESTELVDPSGYNFYPKAGSALLNAGSSAYLTAYDFDCKSRSSSAPTVGAYQYVAGSSPAWTVTQEMKPACGSSSGSSTTGTPSGTTTGSSGNGASSYVLLSWAVADSGLFNKYEFIYTIASLLNIDEDRVKVSAIFQYIGDNSDSGSATFRILDAGDAGQTYAETFVSMAQNGVGLSDAGFMNPQASLTDNSIPSGGANIAVEYDNVSGAERWMPAIALLIAAIALLL